MRYLSSTCSSFHSAPLKLHMGGLGWDINSFIKGLIGAPSPNVPSFSSLSSSVETLYDSVFVISSGRVTSIGPHGEFNWQVSDVKYGLGFEKWVMPCVHRGSSL